MAILNVAVLGGILYLFNGGGFEDLPPLGPFLNPYEGFWMNAHIADFGTTSTTASASRFAQAPPKSCMIACSFPIFSLTMNNDLFFLQGYTHARHRLWQMDFTVRATMGRLAEVLGAGLVSYDRFQRRKGLFKNYASYIKNCSLTKRLKSLWKPMWRG